MRRTRKAWKIALYLQIFDQNQNFSKSLYSILDRLEMVKKTISRYCHFKETLYQTDDSIPGVVPGGDVEQVGLVVVQQQLDDHPRFVAVVL
jgi:hypothetical protein